MTTHKHAVDHLNVFSTNLLSLRLPHGRRRISNLDPVGTDESVGGDEYFQLIVHEHIYLVGCVGAVILVIGLGEEGCGKRV